MGPLHFVILGWSPTTKNHIEGWIIAMRKKLTGYEYMTFNGVFIVIGFVDLAFIIHNKLNI